MDRRRFLESMAALTTGALLAPHAAEADGGRDRLGELLPRRRLGRTGAQVTMLGVGG